MDSIRRPRGDGEPLFARFLPTNSSPPVPESATSGFSGYNVARWPRLLIFNFRCRVRRAVIRHYTAYHNVHRMGALLDDDALCVMTNKPVAKLIGSMVWLVVGDGGSPRRYTLASVFRVTDTGETDHPGFKNCVRGSGRVFLHGRTCAIRSGLARSNRHVSSMACCRSATSD